MKNVIVALTAVLALTACSNRIFRDGIDGKDGAAGTPGQSCSVTQLPDHSGALILCQDGTSTVVLNGQNAAPVVMKQLCPAVASSFPEQAFVLGGKLYAVYSANGNASLAVLTPGTYTTTAPGQNCTFTVAADGVTVTH